MKAWLEYEIDLTPSDDGDQMRVEEMHVVQILHSEMDGKPFFWNGYFGEGYHKLRWGVETTECILDKLKSLLPGREINPWDPLQEEWTQDDELYNRISELKAGAALTVAGLFDFERKYNWHEMSLYFHYLMNCLGFTYMEEALALTSHVNECLLKAPR